MDMKMNTPVIPQETDKDFTGSPSETLSCRDAALSALELGICPIPIKADKKAPVLVKWEEFQKRRPTREEVSQWWKRWPDANLGFVTDELSGVGVIDVDPGCEGWPPDGCELLATCVVDTPRGGRHYYIQMIPGLRNTHGRLAEHVDTRMEGGYILAPPSTIDGKPYRHVCGSLVDILPAPKWLRDQLLRLQADGFVGLKEEPITIEPAKILDGVEQGKRNGTLFRYVCSLRERGYKKPEALVLAREVARNSRPPYPSQASEEPVEDMVNRVYNTYPQPKRRKKKSIPQSELLSQICDRDIHEFTQDQFGHPYVVLRVRGHWEMYSTSDKRFREAWLARKYRVAYGRPPGSEALKQAKIQVKARCYDAPRRTLFNRVAWHEGKILYDLSDSDWRGVEITPDAWRIVPLPPVFRRYKHQVAQPEPKGGGEISALWSFLNVPESARRLFLSTLASWLIPDIPHPILIAHGEPGAAKTTTSRYVKQLIDPSGVSALAPPDDEGAAFQMLDHNWVAPFDNVRKIPDWLSDVLCRAVTGEGASKRQLWTDDEDFLRGYRRCVMITSIGNPAYREDLLDRSILIEMPELQHKREERELDREWKKAVPQLFGCLLDAVVCGLKGFDSVPRVHSFRMADFAHYAMAMAPALGFSADQFVDDYRAVTDAKWADPVENSPFACRILRLVQQKNGAWHGTATELCEEIRKDRGGSDAKRTRLPTTPRTVAVALKEVTPALRRYGIHIEDGGRIGDTRRKLIVLRAQNTEALPLQEMDPGAER